MNNEKHRCVDCGYLALRSWPVRQLVEADDEYRKTTSLPDFGTPHEYDYLPLCFRMKADLRVEIKQITSDEFKVKTEDILSVIQEDRLCDDFTEWVQGLTPKEHYEMREMTEQQKWRADESRKNRRLRIYEIVALAFVAPCIAGGFAYLGYYLGNQSIANIIESLS